jgi:hypothetical protein
MKIVVFVGALHHLRYVEYICEHYNIKKNEIYLYFFYNNHQISFKEYGLSEFKKVNFFHEASFFSFKSLRCVKKKFFRLFSKEFQYSDNIKLFTSISYDYAMIFKSKYINTEILLLDEGFGVFSNINYFKNYRFRIHLRYLLLSLLNFRILKNPFDFKYFSEFNLEGISVNQSVKYEKRKVELGHKSVESETMIILGTTEVEIGYVKLEYYLSLLSSILNKYREYRIYYYPHRKESNDKLMLIEKLGVHIKNVDIPFEYYIIKKISVPKYIVGFASSNAIYEILSKFNSNINIILIDNINESYKMPRLIKQYILRAYDNLNYINHIYSK